MFGRRADLAVAASAQTAKAAGLVQALLLALRAEEAPVSKLSQDAGALHLRLEPLQKLLRILTITKCHERQAIYPPQTAETANPADDKPAKAYYSRKSPVMPLARGGKFPPRLADSTTELLCINEKSPVVEWSLPGWPP